MRARQHVAFAVFLAASLLAAACPGCPYRERFERAEVPKEAVAAYGEAAAFRPLGSAGASRPGEVGSVTLDLAFLVQGSKVESVVIAPYDDDAFYEPVRARLEGRRVTADLPLDKNLLVALDLGATARDNYRAFVQLGAARGLFPAGLLPKICTQILCAPELFDARRLPDRLPELGGLPFDVSSALPPVDLGPIGRPGTLCEDCFDRGPTIVPCVLWRWCGDFPIRRRVSTRRNVYSLSAPEIASLRAGVEAMKARPATDPTSWLYQARMHAIDSGTAAALQDQCQHRQFFFFSWHRMFIYYFERILRAAAADPDLTLPYWNYTDVAAQGALPEPFRVPADATNPLYNGTRQAVYNNGAALPAADVSYASGFGLTNFTSSAAANPSAGGLTVSAPAHFPSGGGSGQLERSPHNNVHNDIGGEMASGESPRDPIFWLHHANLDRLWRRWLALGNGRANPTGDAVWMNQVFTFFDENGAQVNLTGAQILDTVTQLGYRYDDEPYIDWSRIRELEAIPARKFGPPEPLASRRAAMRLGTDRLDVPLELAPESRQSMADALAAEPEEARLVLQVKGIEYDEPVGVTFLLFLNLPPDPGRLDHTHPNFVGTLGFFGTARTGMHAAHEGGVAEDYDVTRLLRRLGPQHSLVLTAVPSLPQAPPDRKDLADQIAQMAPKGNPRFAEVALLRLKAE